MRIGIDIGSINTKIVLLTEENKIVWKDLLKHEGQPLNVVTFFLENIAHQFPQQNNQFSLSFTGSGGEFFVHLLDTEYINEIIAQTKASEFLYPEVKTIIEIGGMSTKVIFSQGDGENRNINEFSMNSICAAGTGSFLDQQARRLGLSIDEFGQMAGKAKNIPRLAGRCSVFAKTDMIHLQQLATPVEEIVAGLCFALVRNFQGTILRGKKIEKPVLFHGGVAANPGIIRALREIFELEDRALFIPDLYFYLNALGAAIFNHQEKMVNLVTVIEKLKNSQLIRKCKILEPLSSVVFVDNLKRDNILNLSNSWEIIDTYLGVDVGSISTNLVLIDEKKNLLAKRYLWTAGRPLEAIQKGLSEIYDEMGDKVRICGVCTTGSGRYLTADFLGADIVKNEITAQARAAKEIDPRVDTIFEIGGQDSKFIALDNGMITDFQMNKVCAAGTGSFLEEQAERLGVKIDQEFSLLALKATSPALLGERCTVFIEEDLVNQQQQGVKKEDLVAGLCYSIVENYLNRVVGEKKIGKNIFFQGGVAFNQGVVEAFKKVLKERIGEHKFIVPEHHEVTGAFGCALIALENARTHPNPTTFKGFDLAKRKYELKSFVCPDCANHCEIKEVKVEGEKSLFYGSRCEKYEINRYKAQPLHAGAGLASKGGADLFAEREKLLLSIGQSPVTSHQSPVRIGIPRIFTFYEFYPFFHSFFSELNLGIILSDPTNRQIINQGLETVPVESCFPHKVSYGHILNLLEKDIDYLFLPSVINFPVIQEEITNSFTCPYVQTLPYVLKVSLEEKIKKKKIKVLQPVLYFREKKLLLRELKKIATQLEVSEKKIKKAFFYAWETQNVFSRQLRERGREILDQLPEKEKIFVIIGRSYNTCDRGMNLDIVKKISNLGILSLPVDFLPLDEIDISEEFPNMYWFFGQRFLAAAEIIKNDKRLYPVYLTNFACGPDSFILKYFKEKISPKPFLEIEIDEHSSDVGIITRLEAFLDSIENFQFPISLPFKVSSTLMVQTEGNFQGIFDPEVSDRREPYRSEFKSNFTLYIPNMCDHAYVLASAFQSFGVSAEVLPESDEETLYWGKKYTLGKECYPCILTTGDMVRKIKSRNFNPREAAFFMPSGCGPCRFGQYNYRQRLVLKELGYPEVPIYAPNQDENIFRDLGIIGGDDFVRLAWQGIVAVDILFKTFCKVRPYEINPVPACKSGVNPGEEVITSSEKVYQESLCEICQVVKERGNLLKVMKKIKEKFHKIPVDYRQRKPRIGIVGEIYIRSNRFSNNNLLRTLEDLGAEVYLTPTTEWLFYVNYLNQQRALNKKNYPDFFSFWIKEKYQEFDAHRLERCFTDPLRRQASFLYDGKEPFKVSSTLMVQTEGNFQSIFDPEVSDRREPSTKKILNYASPYLHSSCEGEAILSIGKSIDLLKKGIDGIINVLPFTCMPGTIVTAILKKIKEEYSGLPCLSIVYDDQDDPFLKTKLEAFIYQAKGYPREKNFFEKDY